MHRSGVVCASCDCATPRDQGAARRSVLLLRCRWCGPDCRVYSVAWTAVVRVSRPVHLHVQLHVHVHEHACASASTRDVIHIQRGRPKREARSMPPCVAAGANAAYRTIRFS